MLLPEASEFKRTRNFSKVTSRPSARVSLVKAAPSLTAQVFAQPHLGIREFVRRLSMQVSRYSCGALGCWWFCDASVLVGQDVVSRQAPWNVLQFA